MFKNVASQKIAVYAFDSTTGAPKTGDAANITAYVSKDFGAVTVLGDTSATEQDATNGKGLYLFDLTQAETNADNLQFSGKSSTSNIYIVPRWIDTLPNRFTTLVIDAAGLADANTVKLGPTGSGTAQTARDIGASVITASGTVTTVTNQLTAAQIATGVWQDTTAGDFTTALSVGKSVMNGVALGTGLTVAAVSGAVGSVTGAVGSVTGNVGGNVVGSVASVTAGVTVTTNNDKTGYALTSGERNSVADAMLDRDMSTGADSGSTTVRTVRQALRFLRNKFAIVAGTLTVYKEDDATSSWTSTLTTTAGNPVSSSDPAGP